MNAPRTAEPLVTRTLRAAVKIGDDYYTLEETIALPPTASDAEIAQAVATGLRIYEAQRGALDAQIAQLREGRTASLPAMREPDAPASEKQRAYMDYLLKELEWTSDQLAAFAAERDLNLLTLTKREASALIDDLKGVLAGVDDATAVAAGQEAVEQSVPVESPPAQIVIPIGERATARQVRALERLVEERGIDLAAELRPRFGERSLAELLMDEAGQLLGEWQQRPRVPRQSGT
jgi:hypothetical protein